MKYQLWILLVVCVCAPRGAASAEAITLSPAIQVGPEVKRWGWDLKGSQNLGSTAAKARIHYLDVPANLVRVPILAAAHFSDGTVDASRYTNVIRSINNIKAINPNVEVFVSLKLLGAATFSGPASEPGWITRGTARWAVERGNIFNNIVNKPNPEFYGQLVADYISFFDSRGISIDYVGLNNETDGALTLDRYADTVHRLNAELSDRGFNTDDIQYIAPDSFGPNTAINYVSNLANVNETDTFNIAGTHFYRDRASHTRDRLVTLSQTSGKPVWFTEAHMNSTNGANNIERMRKGMGMVFAANLTGVDSFVWWQPGDSTTNLERTLKREITKSMVGAVAIETLPGFNEQDPDPNAPLFQAYRDGDRVTLWIANPGAAVADVSIDLRSSFVRHQAGSVVSSYWTGPGNTISGSNSGSLSVARNGDLRGITVAEIPANSIVKVHLDLCDGDCAPPPPVTIFRHNFESGPAGAVRSVGDLGAPGVGSLSFAGPSGPVGAVNITPRMFSVAHKGNATIGGLTEMAQSSVSFSGAYPETQVADAGGGDRLIASLGEPGKFHLPGERTEINFLWGNFGNNNTGAFKYQFVRGLDEQDKEVFELLMVSGSTTGTREFFARGPDDDSTTLRAANAGTPEGTKLIDSVELPLNSTAPGSGPTDLMSVNITLEDGMVAFDLFPTDGRFSATAAMSETFPTNSAATEITKLEWSSVWNDSVRNQNKGYWVGDVRSYTSSPSILADLTGNGFVDFEDLTVLLANWNKNVGTAEGNLVNADTTPVNFEDLTVLLADWTGPGPAGSPEAALGTEAVPEPSALLLGVIAALGIGVYPRRRRRAA